MKMDYYEFLVPKTIRMPIAFQSPNEGVVLNGVPALRTQTDVFYNIKFETDKITELVSFSVYEK